MLILSRKCGQKLIINDNIVITIIESGQNVVKIGFDAPKDVKIFREEIYLEIKSENISSNKSLPDDIALLEQFAKTSGQEGQESKAKITIKHERKSK